MTNVFLGGTRGNNDWRIGLISRLADRGVSTDALFNPFVYSLCEAIFGILDRSDATIVVFDTTGMPDHQVKNHDKTCRDLQARFPDANIFPTLSDAEEFFASRYGNATISER